MTEETRPLRPADLPALRELAARCLAADSHPPFNDQTGAALQQGRTLGIVATAEDGRLLAAAVHADGVWEIAVEPSSRGHGLGLPLARLARAERADPLWAHGDHPAARRIARRLGLRPVRTLHSLTRRADIAVAARPLPPGLAALAFRAGDEKAWLRLNAIAFRDDPDQGSLTSDDLCARLAEPWFRAEDLRILWQGRTPVGFCWTKRTSRSAGGRTVSDAEIYALGVSPAWQGRGIGSALLADALARPGDADRFSLYVDAANRRALGLYQRAGFEIADTDVLWGT